jgi:diapolycopene oxygenase
LIGKATGQEKNKSFKAPQKSEKYKNLCFVRGSVNPGGGMPMVFLSGQQVKDKIVKEQQGK